MGQILPPQPFSKAVDSDLKIKRDCGFMQTQLN